MKYTLTLILTTCLSIQMIAQNSFDKQRLDSLIISYYEDENDPTGENRTKETYKYAENEQLIEHHSYDWNTDTENWQIRFEHIYDENSNQIWYAEYRSDTIYESIEKNYDNNGNLVLNIEHYHIQFTVSFLKKRSEYTYDSNNNTILEIRYYGQASASTWESVHRYEYEYDEYNNNTSESVYEQSEDGESWIGIRKKEYEYDENSNKILGIEYDWSADSQSWVNKEKYEYTYDSNGNKILEIGYEWSADTQLWVNDYKHERTYNTNNDKTLEIRYEWELNTQTWKEHKKYEYTYDNYGNRAAYDTYTWNDDTNEFVLSANTIYTNTYTGGILQQILYSSYNDGLLTGSGRTDYDSNGSVTYSYSRSHDCGYYKEYCYASENTYVYDENNQPIGATSLSGNPLYWEQGETYGKTYTNGNLTQHYEERYMDSYGWERWFTDLYEYDTTYTYDDLITPFQDNNKRISYTRYNGYPGIWNSLQVGIYYYSQEDISIDVESPEIIPAIAVYPNPANDFVIFDH